MRIRQIITFIILVAIFYAALAFNVFHIGDKLVPSGKNYLEINTPEQSQSNENNDGEMGNNKEQTGHFSADNGTTNLESLCTDSIICEKTHFKGTFSDTEKYNYIKSISKITQFIDNNGSEETPIEDVITNIDISKQNGKRRGYATRDSILFNI